MADDDDDDDEDEDEEEEAAEEEEEEEEAKDELRVGKFRTTWKIGNVEEKLRWHWREMKSPPLRTSRFPFMGTRGFQLKFWPDGNDSSKKGYCALHLHYPENWGALTQPITLFVGPYKRGPLTYRSQEYWKAAMSLCRLEDLDLSSDELEVGVEVGTA